MAVIGTAIAGVLIGAGVPAVAASIIGSLLVSVATTALSRALQGQEDGPAPSGIKTSFRTAGDNTPQTLIFGAYATAGNMTCPPMTHGRASGTPNAFLTMVRDVADTPVTGLAALWINDEKVTLGPPDPVGSWFPNHRPVTTGQYAGLAWVRFYDGTQTVASDSLITIGNTDRPWGSDMIGRGVAYAVLRFKFNEEVFRSEPTVLFEIDGTGFYDPRKDSTVGGSGTHRWGNRATYTSSANPAVQVYNILRGITLPDGAVWGGDAAAEDLPLSNWFAAMNECNKLVDGESQYRASTEVRVGPEHFGGQEPAAVVEELLRCCSGQLSEFGGVWKIRVGPVGMPVMVLTDEDIIVSEDQTFDPFPGLQQTYNAVHAQYPEPAEKWVSKEAPPRYNAAYEAQDQNRRLVASLALGACPYPAQVQRLMRAYVEDERRHRRHALTLPPDYAALEPLDAVAWSSERNGYNSKVFEVGSKVDGARSLMQRLSLRERDPADYDWQAGYLLPSAVSPVAQTPIAPQAVPGWSVAPTTVKDSNGVDRRPAIVMGWDPDQPGVRGIAYEVRVVGRTDLAAQGSTQNVLAGGLIVAEGILPQTNMEARGRLMVARRAIWTPWTPVTTLAAGFTNDDFAQGIESLFSEQGLYAIRDVHSLPPVGSYEGQLVFNRADGKLHRWNSTAWVEIVADALVEGLDETAFAAGISIPRVYSALPASGYTGQLAVLSGDGKLYRWNGTAWTAAVPAVDITGQLTNAQIAGLAAAKLTGTIAETQIANGAITTPKIMAGAVVTASLSATAVTADKIAANAVTAVKVAAGAIGTAKLAAGAITTDKLDANAVTTPKIAAGAIGADQIAANAIVASKLLITDFTNLVVDGDLQDPANWAVSAPAGNITHAPSYGVNNPGAKISKGAWIVTPGSANAAAITGPWAPANAEQQFFASSRIGATASGMDARLYLQFADASYAVVGSNYVSKSTATFETVSWEGVAPANTAWVRIAQLVPASAYGGVAQIVFGSPVLRLKLGGRIIVDGTITGDKIVANTITGGLLAASGIITNSAQINNALITSAKIGNLEVDTIKIRDGAISSTAAANLPDTSVFVSTWAGSLVFTPYGSQSNTLVNVTGYVSSGSARIYVNGGVHSTFTAKAQVTGRNASGSDIYANFPISVSFSRVYGGAGPFTVQVRVDPAGAQGGVAQPGSLNDCTISITELKK